MAAGGIVHWARDAAEANAIVVGLVRDAGADEVVKVKSMATQEIELNEALAAAGIAAWETDLAELIVQLGRDLPSHFLVPAIHRNRTEIREIFVREMGLAGRPAPDGLTDEPPELAEAARLHLREKFLRAKVAISGANFAVAETGTVMVVESEGNGRMCLTLPDTLITVMGMEKLVPRWPDLEVFLQLLPRSSTAERMNPYTSMWTGVTPGDGPQTFHLVLLDNGRSATLSDPVGRQALRCIKCSACLNVCPVYERTGGRAYGSPYAGPIGAILTPQLRGIATHKVDEQTASLPYASSLCGACFEVCPVRIDIPEVLVHLRAKVVEQHGWRSAAVAGGAADRRPVRSLRGLGAARRGGAGRRPSRRGWWPARAASVDSACPGSLAPGSVRATSGAGGARSDAGGGSARDDRGARGDPRGACARRWPTGRPFPRSPADYRRTPRTGPTSWSGSPSASPTTARTCGRPRRGSRPAMSRRPGGHRVRAGSWSRPASPMPGSSATAWTRRGRAAAAERRARRHRRRHDRLRDRHRRDGHDRPRRRPRPGSTCADASSPTTICASSARTRSSTTSRGGRAPRPAPPADLDQRPVSDERHRAPPRRGRPRPAPSVRADRHGRAATGRMT